MVSSLGALLEPVKKLANALAPRFYVRARARFRAIVGPADPNLTSRLDAFERRVAEAAAAGRIEPRVAERLRRFADGVRADVADDPSGTR